MTANPAATGRRAYSRKSSNIRNGSIRACTEAKPPRLAAFLLDFGRGEAQAIDFQGFVLHIWVESSAMARRTIGQWPVL
jgi:hypothetical protein